MYGELNIDFSERAIIVLISPKEIRGIFIPNYITGEREKGRLFPYK